MQEKYSRKAAGSTKVKITVVPIVQPVELPEITSLQS